MAGSIELSKTGIVSRNGWKRVGEVIQGSDIAIIVRLVQGNGAIDIEGAL